MTDLQSTDLMNLLMVACALGLALAFGVFSAYAILRFGFSLMQPAGGNSVNRDIVKRDIKTKPEMARSLP